MSRPASFASSAICLLLLLLSSAPAVSASARLWREARLPKDIPLEVDYLIVTNAECAPAFGRLAGHRAAQSLASLVVTMEQILPLYPQGRDTQESLRMFLQDAHAAWGLRSLVLGGDHEIVPTREIEPPENLSDVYRDPIQTDLYYAALDGNWDSDGDGQLGELPNGEDHGDSPDVVAELVIGRIPVRNAAEAETYIDKLLIYEAAQGSAYRGRALAAADIFRAYEPQYDMSFLAEEWIDALPASSDLEITRFYASDYDWPEQMPQIAEDFRNVLGSGDHGIVLLAAAGSEDEVCDVLGPFGVDDATALQNDYRPFVWLTMAPWNARIVQDSVQEALLRHPLGGAIASAGWTTTTYLTTSTSLVSDLLVIGLGSERPTLGEAMRDTRNNCADKYYFSSFQLTAMVGFTLLGDPELRLYPPEATGGPAVASGLMTRPVRMDPPYPNPFNPSTTIRFEIEGDGQAPARLEILDLTGRVVCTLLDGSLPPGQYERSWAGTDRLGVRVASGVYYARLRALDLTVTHRMVLLK